jgi:hypothetical protein
MNVAAVGSALSKRRLPGPGSPSDVDESSYV